MAGLVPVRTLVIVGDVLVVSPSTAVCVDILPLQRAE